MSLREGPLPAGCNWFALCPNQADGYVEHPVLGKVPTCRDCAERFELALRGYPTEPGYKISVFSDEDGLYAVTHDDAVVGSVWEDGGAWYWGADGASHGPYRGKYAAVLELCADYAAYIKKGEQ